MGSFDVLSLGSKSELLVDSFLVVFLSDVVVFEHAVKNLVLTVGSGIRIGAKRGVAGRSLGKTS